MGNQNYEAFIMNKGNLLIVDDEEIILKRLKFNLEDYADNVYTSINGVLALKEIEKYEIHCIVCDINMPKMNGVELIKEIRAQNNNVPFIFYTAHGNQDLMMEAVKYGAFDFLDKPNLDGLEEVVSRGLQEGYGTNNNEDATVSDDYLSEYKKLLNQINNNN